MVWIRLCISCIAFFSAAGGISFGMTKLAGSVLRIENLAILSSLQKLTLVLYWLPVSFVCVCIPRISFNNDGSMGYTGEFVCSSVRSMTVVFNALGVLWLAVFLASVVWSGIKMCRLAAMRRGNVPVRDARYLDIFEAHRRQKGGVNVSLSQNDLLSSPITAGFFKKQIILLFVDYTDTELRMIFEHELTHIQNRDLPWRIFMLVTSWVHWFNPAIHLQSKDLDCLQEMICDLSVSIDNAYYTKKEYAAFLVKLTDQEAVNVYTPALAENKNQTIRRIQKMAKTKKFVKPGKKVIGFSCTCLAVLALMPATAVSAEAAKLQEDWLRAEEVSEEVEPLNFSNSSLIGCGYDDGSVIEIDGSLENVPYSSKVELDKTINANTRYIYQYRNMSAGDSITITTYCDDASATYKIGIKNKETGKMDWKSGTGKLVYDFEISENGSYSAFVENNNNYSINIEGTAVY